MRLHEILENFADGKRKGKSRHSRVKNVQVQVVKDVTSLRKRLGNPRERAKMYLLVC